MYFDQNTLPSKSLLVIEGYNTNIAVSVSVTFSDCVLSRNIFSKNSYLIDVSAVAANITLKNNNVYRNWHMKLITFSTDTDKLESAELHGSHLSKIFIENTKFWENEIDTYIISTSKASLRLDKVTFLGNSGVGLIAMNFKAATLRLHGQISIAFNKLAEVLYDIGKCAHKTLTITIEEDTEVMIRFNNIYTLVGCDQQWLSMRQPHLPCFFQFYSKRGNLDNEFYHEVLLNYSITFDENVFLENSSFTTLLKISHCSWLPYSAFQSTKPIDVNTLFISFTYEFHYWKVLHGRKHLCVCQKNDYNCHQDTLGPIYPGETLNLDLFKQADNFYPINTYYDTTSATECKIVENTNIHLSKNHCTKLNFTILSTNDQWCELFIKEHLNNNDDYYNLEKFYVDFKASCPLGFVKYTDRCECDRNLSFIGISTCDINKRAILRPVNVWIIGNTKNPSIHNYMFSKSCPFDYCLPHPSYVNLSNPDSQCQFNRSGLLCGHCQQHLSTTFASYQCQRCSNVYLLLIIPFALLGALLVFVMFAINLTVTEGTVNAFVLYVNIASINDTIFFPLHQFSYVFISIANLDFGIKYVFTMEWMTMLKCGYSLYSHYISFSFLFHSSSLVVTPLQYRD